MKSKLKIEHSGLRTPEEAETTEPLFMLIEKEGDKLIGAKSDKIGMWSFTPSQIRSWFRTGWWSRACEPNAEQLAPAGQDMHHNMHEGHMMDHGSMDHSNMDQGMDLGAATSAPVQSRAPAAERLSLAK